MSFLPFFHSLISEGIIPYGNYVFTASNHGNASGGYGEIRSNDFTTASIREKLVAADSFTDDASLEISGNCLNGFQYTFLLSFDKKWKLTRSWKSTHKICLIPVP
jgi:hypothetical protein